MNTKQLNLSKSMQFQQIHLDFSRLYIPLNSLKEQNYFEQIKSLTKTQKMGMNTTEALLCAEHFTLFAHLALGELSLSHR